MWLFFFLVMSSHHSHRLCSVFLFLCAISVTACCLRLVPSPTGRAPRRFIPRLRGPLGVCFSFSCRSVLLSRLFIVQRFDFWVPCQRSSSWCWIPHLPPKLLFFFSPISVSACLHLLSRDLFSPFFSPALKPSHSQDNRPVQIFASHRAAVLVS
jgi:hypothetical protein